MDNKVKDSKIVLSTRPFKVEELQFADSRMTHPYYRLKCDDWVNILPITETGEAVLIRQFRAGSLTNILELPGGCVDAAEVKDPTIAARRELEEETGYTCTKILSLASLNPNPAIQNNKIHFFLALGCYQNPQRKHFPDVEENITVELFKATQLEELVRFQRIDHSLSALCIMLSARYIKISEV